MMTMRRKFIFFAPIAILGVLLFIALGGAIVHWLWNWLLPPLFGWKEITFWQGIGLLALCRILFGGVAGRGHGGFRRRMRDRWDGLTPEERDRFRARMHERWGHAAPGPEGGDPSAL